MNICLYVRIVLGCWVWLPLSTNAWFQLWCRACQIPKWWCAKPALRRSSIWASIIPGTGKPLHSGWCRSFKHGGLTRADMTLPVKLHMQHSGFLLTTAPVSRARDPLVLSERAAHKANWPSCSDGREALTPEYVQSCTGPHTGGGAIAPGNEVAAHLLALEPGRETRPNCSRCPERQECVWL